LIMNTPAGSDFLREAKAYVCLSSNSSTRIS